jgi:hypothetical protein
LDPIYQVLEEYYKWSAQAKTELHLFEGSYAGPTITATTQQGGELPVMLAIKHKNKGSKLDSHQWFFTLTEEYEVLTLSYLIYSRLLSLTLSHTHAYSLTLSLSYSRLLPHTLSHTRAYSLTLSPHSGRAVVGYLYSSSMPVRRPVLARWR